MFAKINRSKGCDYLYIVESFRDEFGKSRHKPIASLGRLDEAQKEGKLKKLLKSIMRICNEENKIFDIENSEEKERIYWGSRVVIKKLWDLFNFDEIFGSIVQKRKIQFNFFSAVQLMLNDRFASPCSKYQTYLNQAKYGKNEEIELQHFYRALDILAQHKDDIQKKIFQRNKSQLNTKVDVVLYDVTTLRFESVKANSLKDFGYSKDNKFSEVQVVVGLITNQEGMPLGFEVFPGNLYEGDTLKSAIIKLKAYDIEKLVFIADQGMLSAENIFQIQKSGYDYIIGARIKSRPKKIKEDILNLSTYETVTKPDQENVLKIKSIEAYDRQELLTIKILCEKNLFDRKDLAHIRKLCRAFENTASAKRLQRFASENLSEVLSILKLISTNKSDEVILEKIIKLNNLGLKGQLNSELQNQNKINEICKRFLKNQLIELKALIDVILEERLVITWSKKRQEKNKKDRERLFAKAETIVNENKPIISHLGYKRYINIEAKTPTLDYTKKVEEEQWDGFFGIQTNNKEYSMVDIANYYHMLWRIEETFRIFKSHLETRPIYHYTPGRITGHLVLCFVALILERALEIKLNKRDVDSSTDKIRKAISSLQASKVEVEGEIFYLRSPIPELAEVILEELKIKIPLKVSRSIFPEGT